MGDDGNGKWVEFRPGPPRYSAPGTDPTVADRKVFGEGVQTGSARAPSIADDLDPTAPARNIDTMYEYRIGSRDLLEIEVFQVEELNHKTRVTSRGDISFPLIGGIKVKGLTLEEAERKIADKLGEKYLQNPQVSIFIAEYESQKFTVDGEVKDPGVFPLRGPTTLMQAVAMADGLDRLADSDEIVIFRSDGQGKVRGYIVDLDAIRAGEGRDPYIAANDFIVIPRAGEKAFLEGLTRALRGFVGFAPL